MELYRVNIDSENYFEANSLEIRPSVRIVDIRSLRGHITIDFNAKDEHLKELILRYLQNTDNVELINILSREYNEYNWFEAYDESYNSNVEYSKEQLLRIQNSEVNAIARTSQIVNPRRFISDVRDKSGHLKPSALYTHLHGGLPINQKLDLESLDFIPVWYINGNTNDAKCELFCCFEILIHILAKRFIDFKAKLLQLASTDIQLAKTNNQSVSRYLHLTQNQLIHKIEKLKAEKEELIEAKDDLNVKFDNYKAEAEARHQELLAQNEASAQRIELLIKQNEELIASNNKQSEDIDTLQNMVFGVSSQVSDVQRTLHRREDDIEYLTKAAGFAVHELKKQTIANSKVDSNNDITVLYRSELKPASDDVRAQATETQIWIGSYNGDKANYIPSKLPADYDEIYYIESNRLNSFKYLLTHEELAPFIVRSYQRSILIEEDDLEEFINTVDRVLNSNHEFKSIISLEKAKKSIEAKQKENKEIRKLRDFKIHILNDYSPVHIVVNRFKRLVYCYIVDENGNEVLTALANVDREHVIKAKWFYRYGAGGKYIQELSFASIEKSTFSKYGDARIHYED